MTMSMAADTNRVGLVFEGARPDFDKPPVTEVALSVQFEPLQLHAVHFGLLWENYRADLKDHEDKAPLNTIIEQFGEHKRAAAQLELLQEPVLPRCWFSNHAGTELVQVQRDRFVFNWRRAETEDPYPRYGHVRAKFEEYFLRFQGFIEAQEVGSILPNQCEVTYVNHVSQDEGDTNSRSERIFSILSGHHSDSFLPSPEDTLFHVRYVMENVEQVPIGRLHVHAEPRVRIEDQKKIVRLNMTARGAPLSPDIGGALDFFDIGREFVVRAFASITTPEMHQVWGRKNAGESPE